MGRIQTGWENVCWGLSNRGGVGSGWAKTCPYQPYCHVLRLHISTHPRPHQVEASCTGPPLFLYDLALDQNFPHHHKMTYQYQGALPMLQSCESMIHILPLSLAKGTTLLLLFLRSSNSTLYMLIITHFISDLVFPSRCLCYTRQWLHPKALHCPTACCQVSGKLK